MNQLQKYMMLWNLYIDPHQSERSRLIIEQALEMMDMSEFDSDEYPQIYWEPICVS
jgi:hypothetical protein